MPNNQLVEKSKLTLIQRIKKNSLIKKISGERYDKAPEYLKVDPDVIQALMAKSNLNISHLSDGFALEYIHENSDIFTELSDELQDHYLGIKIELIKLLPDERALQYIDENPNAFRNLNFSLQKHFLAKKPEMFRLLDNDTQKRIIFSDESYKYIKYLPAEKQVEYLTQKTSEEVKLISGVLDQNGINYDGFTLKTEPFFFSHELHCFDESALLEAIKLNKEILDRGWRDSDDNEAHEKLNMIYNLYKYVDLSKLPQDTKVKILNIDNRFISKCDTDTLIRFIDGNPVLFKMLPQERQDEIKEVVPSMNIYNSNKDRSFYNHVQEGLDYDDAINIAILNGDSYESLKSLKDSVQDSDMLWEIAKIIPQALSARPTYSRDNYKGLNEQEDTKGIFKSKINNDLILDAIEQSRFFKDNLKNYDDRNLNSAICKVLTDKKVLDAVDSSRIADFVKEPNDEKFKELIIDTYGENAKRVLESRPGITADIIPNLRIFDPVIFEEFGEATVHNQLTYNTKFSILLADFADHPEKIQEYKKFEKLTDGLFIQNSAGNEEKLSQYLRFSTLLPLLDGESLTTDRIKSLRLAIADRKISETKTIKLENLEDLDMYVAKRNKMYDEALKKVTDPQSVKEIISKRFFGIDYKEKTGDNEGVYTASTLTMQELLKYYSIDNLLKDKRTYESDLFDKDDLDAIELANIISKIDDVEVLNKIYNVLAERENVISPIEFETIKQKIPLQYSRELVSQLLTPEKAREKIENGEEGITIEQEDGGIEIINLTGADFKIMMHSFLSVGQTNSGFYISPDIDKSELWKYFENGCSTISSCVIEPNMLNSCAVNESVINFGFSNIDPRLIIGMSHQDAHVVSKNRRADPDFQFSSVKFNYPEELIRKTAAQISGIEEEDAIHEYNEVTTYRNEQDPNKVGSDNLGGKIMPDYIVVFGEITDTHRNLAKAMGKNGKPLPIVKIHEENYRNNMFARAHKKDTEHTIKSKEDSEFIKEIKEIEYEGREQRNSRR